MRTLRLDIVSDVVCPWCAIGLANLEAALASAADVVVAEIHFHPLQLNPGLPPEGELIADNVARKYRITAEQARERGRGLRAAARQAGVPMAGRSDRIFDTFDAHRLLHWAGARGRQQAMKHALLEAYFEQGLNVSDPDVLANAAAAAGLDRPEATTVLARGTYAAEVADDEIDWRAEGVSAVPTIVIDREFVINGAQPPDRLEKALRRLAGR